MYIVVCKCCRKNILEEKDREKGGVYKDFCLECIEKYKGKTPPFRCTCGKEFDSYSKLKSHRKNQKQKGTPCKPFERIYKTTKCRWCGATIALNHHTEKLKYNPYESDRLHRKTCPVFQKIIRENGYYTSYEPQRKLRADGFHSGKYIKSVLNSEKNKTNVYKTYKYSETTIQQMIWVRKVFDEEKIPYKVSFGLERCKSIHNGIADLEMLIEFDNEIPEYFTEPLLKEGWCIVNLKWLDLMDKEQDFIDLIKLCIKSQEEKLGIKK